MTKRELEKKLKSHGWKIINGTKHDMAIRDDTGMKIPIPRHKGDLDAKTARSILNEAGIE